ncbi:MAG: glycoside hydrolase family 2 protein, partial [Oscillospiraceae bacterium]
VRKWNGRKDPFLYTLRAELWAAGGPIDEVTTRFGCREFSIDKDKGFFLNGASYPLRGVSRHQDYQGVGNAITREMMQTDMALLKDLGANTVRLAHYQHDQFFYDLCDEVGIVVWAEIPYITEHMQEANENTASQLTELITQNYNHPSIVCWGLSNEITAVGGYREEILENHVKLNELAHRLDATRPTVTANVFMLEVDSPILEVPDILSYNLYFGWYVGNVEGNDEWFADFRKKNPGTVIGLSEYGADANPQYQTANPERSDYTEQYQAVYHEHMLKLFDENPYIWATHVWNMFDFGADGRNEGGKHGQNQKGLITFDRQIKKDAYFAYKAHWSKEPFVHVCGRRYVDRAEEITCVKVYSNQRQVSLFCDGQLVGEKEGQYVFSFDVPIQGQHTIEAKCGACSDTITIKHVKQENPTYKYVGTNLQNWFEEGELQFPEGYYSIKDKMGDIKSCPEGAALVKQLMDAITAKRGDVAQGIKMNDMMIKMMDAMTLESALRQGGDAVAPQVVLQMNQALNQIAKTKA